jgi:hypothetical protein
MIEFIKQIPNYQNLTDEQIADSLNSASVQRVDEQLYTWAGVALIVGPQAAEGLRIALEANGMGWVVHQLGGSGIQLSNPMVQAALLGFSQAGVPGCSDLAAKGVSLVSVLAQAGLPAATADSVRLALFEDSKASLIQAAADRYNSFVAAVNAWDGSGEEPVL